MENKGNNNDNNNRKNGGGNNRNGMTILVFILAALLVLFLTSLLNSCARNATNKEITYSEFINMIENDKVEEVKFTSNRIKILPKSENKLYRITYYTAELKDETLLPLLKKHHVKFGGTVEDVSSAILWNMVSYILPLVLVWVLLYFLIFRKMGGGGVMGVGKTTAKVYVEKSTGVTFKDVAGQDEAKESLQEVVDFLHNPKKYTDIGAKLPKGALLVGPPGTGKTLLAKAVAGEANVPFFSLAGSDFVEMFVGVGASRVRDLFKEAQKQAPCIIFIDEIDAIGKSRDSRYGGNDEREQTLNQLLAEMDGFDTSKGLLILAATNRPDVLDKALLRPGRFDRRIIVDKPDLKGRVETLKVHAKNVLMDDTVDLDAIALATSGAVGSDLANMINEAAINAVKHGRKHVNQSDLFESVEVVIAGKEKKDRIMGPKEKKMVAYHEVGHALVTALQKDTEPVQKITIVPRTMGALGYTMQVPEEEKYLMTKNELIARIVTYMGGRAAEEIVFDSVTTGASNDIEQATKMARAMVTQYGMSERFGLMGLVTVEDKYLEGRASLNCGEETAAQIDQEVMKILKESYDEAMRLLRENRDILNEISEYLYEHETITGKEFMQIFRELKGITEEEEKEQEQKAGDKWQMQALKEEVVFDIPDSEDAEEYGAEDIATALSAAKFQKVSEEYDALMEEELEDEDYLEVNTLEEPLPEELMYGNTVQEEREIQIIPLAKPVADDMSEIKLAKTQDMPEDEYTNREPSEVCPEEFDNEMGAQAEMAIEIMPELEDQVWEEPGWETSAVEQQVWEEPGWETSAVEQQVWEEQAVKESEQFEAEVTEQVTAEEVSMEQEEPLPEAEEQIFDEEAPTEPELSELQTVEQTLEEEVPKEPVISALEALSRLKLQSTEAGGEMESEQEADKLQANSEEEEVLELEEAGEEEALEQQEEVEEQEDYLDKLLKGME